MALICDGCAADITRSKPHRSIVHLWQDIDGEGGDAGAEYDLCAACWTLLMQKANPTLWQRDLEGKVI